MKHIQLSSRLRRIMTKPVIFTVALLAVAVAGFGTYHKVTAQVVTDCSTNSIITCGAQTPADFIAKLQANNPADLQAIYSGFTLTPDKYADFAQRAKMGTAYKNGTLVVDGQVVATDTWSIGREKKSYSTDDPIAGKTYYKSFSKDVFAANSIPTMVYFNQAGAVQFAVLTACGNPMGGTQTQPGTGTCDLIQKTPVQGQANTYNFSTKTTAANGGKITKVVYDWGDGSAPQTADPAAQTPHTFSKAGTFNVKATAYVSTVSGAEAPVTSQNCMTQIVVQAPPTQPPAVVATGSCIGLQATANAANPLDYTFTVTTATNNSTFTSAVFDYGDGLKSGAVGPYANAPTTAASQHTFAKAGTYTVSATVSFNPAQGGQAIAPTTCSTTLPVSQPVVTAPAPVAPVTTAAAVTPVAAPVPLPNAGPVGTAGLFGATSAIGAVGYGWRLRRKTNLINKVIDKMTKQD